MNNEPLSPTDSTPAQDRATEALLREYARLQSRDDEPFLAAFESKLAQEPEPDAAPVIAQIGAQMIAQPNKRRRIFQIAALAAAACLLAMASWYAGYSSKKVQLVEIVQQAPTPVVKPETTTNAPAKEKTQTPGAVIDLSLHPASSKPLVTRDKAGSLQVSAPKSSDPDIAGLTGLSDVNLRNDLGLLSAGSEKLGRTEFERSIAKQTPGVTLDDLTQNETSIERAAGGFAMTGTLEGANSILGNRGPSVAISQSFGGSTVTLKSDAVNRATGSVVTLGGNSSYTGDLKINEGALTTMNKPDYSTISGVISGSSGSLIAPVNAALPSAGVSFGNTSSSRTLSTANTYTGATTTTGGVVSSTNAGSTSPPAAAAPAPSSVNSLTLNSTGGITMNGGTLAFNPTGKGNLSPTKATVTGSATITKSGAGNWTLDRSSIASTGVQFESRVILAPGVPPLTTPTDKDSPGNRYEAAPINRFLTAQTQPLSTFSIDVDTASYANIRRLIQSGSSVPPAAVRLEEMINYFPYTHVEPTGEHPFSVKVESAACPWAPAHRLVKIALKAKDIDRSKRAAANLVFLVDVSGSMSSEDKLALVIKNLRILTAALNADDTVSIVTYAGNSGVALPPTHGDKKQIILDKLASLSSGGSTNGAGGIMQAYEIAKKRFIKEGVNRVVLCTDGDFNVGITGKQSLVDLVKERAQDGIFLTVCGYGQGNLNDAMLEAITNKGNGIYHYIDSEREGRKVFQDELFGTLVTVAKDVKLQIEFNPAQAAQYRLIGYDNRMLAKEDFANDKVDAGDMGAGHRVTALYEVIPTAIAGANSIPLKYQSNEPAPEPAKPASPELLAVKLRYKEPAEKTSRLFDQPFTDDANAKPSTDFTFAAVVSEFGNWLRGERADGRTLAQMIEAAEAARGDDPHGYRAEFVELMKHAK